MYYNLDEYTSDIDWFADLITQELGDKLLPIRGNEHNLHFNKISAKRTPGCNPEKLCQELSLWYDYIIHSGSFVGRTIEFVMKGCSKGLAISVMSNVLGTKRGLLLLSAIAIMTCQCSRLPDLRLLWEMDLKT